MHNDLSTKLSLSDIIVQFQDAMREQGIETKNQINPDGQLHRFHVEGDSRGSKNGFYKLNADFPPNGIFGCNKRYGDKIFKWKPDQNTAPMTPEERKALAERIEKERAEREAKHKARHEAAAAAANQIWDASVEATDDHPYLKSKGVKAHGLRVGKWEQVNKETGEVRLISSNALLVPVCDRTRKIHSLQAIFPSKLAAMGNRNKDYLTDGAKRGLFFTIGTPLSHHGKPVFVLCEGYATGASIHECTGHLVLVCFDAGNLPVVAQAIHERFKAQQKEAIILLAADNDRWTTQPIENPGVHHAKNAAKAVNGLLVVPDFETLDGNPTDFNDLHLRQGVEAVAKAFNDTLNPPAPTLEDLPWDDTPTTPEPPQIDGEPPDDDEFEDELVKNTYFTILGYDGPVYYIFQHEKRQVMDLRKGDLAKSGLIEIAPTKWWEEHFPGKDGMDVNQAANWFFRQANARGIYDPTRIRGRGAWKDKDRYVFHHGDRLTVDSVPMDITRIASAYVYPMARRLPEPSEQMLTAEEGKNLIKVAEMVRWSKPASAALLAGWTMLAPICGALKWRPHIWITGGAGSGKTTIQRDFVAALTGGVCVFAQGNSTEAGIRQELKADALPVLMDEAESNDDKERARMEAIMAMIRQASSESHAKTLKGTISGQSMRFAVRSMFCLASVNTNLDKKADVDRLTKLVIRPPALRTGADDHWNKLSDELHKISTDETISSRLLARALVLLPTILKNVEVFTRVAAKFFGSQREGDQFGTMLAGAWSLCSDAIATDEAAMKLIERYDWGEHTEDHDQDDAERALEAVLGAKIRMGSAGDLTVYELVRESLVSYKVIDSVTAKEADAALRRHGIRVDLKTDSLLFGTSVSNLKKLVERTSFVTDLRGQLLRLPDANRHDDKAVNFNGHKSKCVAIKLTPLLRDGDDSGPDELPI